MRAKQAIMTSRREFLSNALGVALVTASTWPIRAQALSMHGQSDRSTFRSERATQKIPLSWDVFLAPSIPAITSDLPPGEKERPWPPISSTLYFWGAGRGPGRHPYYRRAGSRPGELGCGWRKESNDHLRHPRPWRSFLWRQCGSGSISKCPFHHAA
jgi:hypothetical protein